MAGLHFRVHRCSGGASSGQIWKGTRTHEALDNLVGSSRDRRGVFLGHGLRRGRRARRELRRSGGDGERDWRRRWSAAPAPARGRGRLKDANAEEAPQPRSRHRPETGSSRFTDSDKGQRRIRAQPKCWRWRPAICRRSNPARRRRGGASGGTALRQAPVRPGDGGPGPGSGGPGGSGLVRGAGRRCGDPVWGTARPAEWAAWRTQCGVAMARAAQHAETWLKPVADQDGPGMQGGGGMGGPGGPGGGRRRQ